MKRVFVFYFITLIPIIFSCKTSNDETTIDRFALVTRHNIRNSNFDSLSVLTVGNGEFAFTADLTGMQSFSEFYEQGIPLGTQSQWAWHTFPNPEGYKLEDTYKKYKTGEDSTIYVYQYTESPDQRKNLASQWLRENPQRLHLGLIGLEIFKSDSTPLTISDVKNPVQELNLWKGELKSRFEIEGTPVEVLTYCHQDLDMVTFKISSDLLSSGRMKVKIHFPYAIHEKFGTGYDFDHPDKHITQILDSSDNRALFKRQLDNDVHYVQLAWTKGGVLNKQEDHLFTVMPGKDGNSFEFSCHFTKDRDDKMLPAFAETEKNNIEKWEKFWKSGGAVDFSACTDTRATELERRVVLSQYLTKVQCSGSLPPQETGLTYNSWHGKFHLEMHWWHGIHFILWQRPELVEQQMQFYFDIFERAKGTAAMQGYKGVRWPKMVGYDGRESPSTIGTFLIWQQPHIIYFSELLYRNSKEDSTVLNKYKKLVFATADFMASYARWDSVKNYYVLGPALIPAQECFDPVTTIDPSFEVAYWYWALKTAQQWRERAGMEKDEKWQEVIDKLAPLPKTADDLYLFSENVTDSYTNPIYKTDHPIVLGVVGFLPKTDKVDPEVMRKTLKKVQEIWHWESIWGWDPPLAAMNAAILAQPEEAVSFLLMDTQKNTYLLNGHNYQDERLPIYLPGNGGLLTAVAMMCTSKNENGSNGFPENGKWDVKYENLDSLY